MCPRPMAASAVKTAALESAQTQGNLATGYSSAAQLASNQVNLQDTQLSQLSSLASQLQQDVTTAVANGNGGTLMSQAQSIFDQAVQILNSQDANGNYIYSGGNANTPPVSITSLSQLTALPSAAQAFTNGTDKASVHVGENQTVQIGVLASDVGTQLMQTLQDIANSNASSAFGTQLTSAQTSFLTSEIPNAQTAAQTINQASASNGEIYQELQAAQTQQQFDVDALSGLCLRRSGRRHGDGGDQSERRTRRPCRRRFEVTAAAEPAFAAQLSAHDHDDTAGASGKACRRAWAYTPAP